MKISWIVIVVVIAVVLFRKQIGDLISAAAGTLAADPNTTADSAATKSPLENLLSSTETATKTKGLLAQMIDNLQLAKQDVYASDLIDDIDNVAVSGVSQSDFLTTLRSQEEKIFAVPNAAAIEARGGDVKEQRKQDQTWWPNILFSQNPSWN